MAKTIMWLTYHLKCLTTDFEHLVFNKASLEHNDNNFTNGGGYKLNDIQ